MTDNSKGFECPSPKEVQCTWMGLAIDYDFDMLKQLLDVVRNYTSGIQDYITTHIKDLEESGEVPQGTYDSLSDEVDMAQETERVMYACFGIAVFSVIENTVGEFCKINDIELQAGVNWGAKRIAVEHGLDVDFETFPGIKEVTELRLLSNCFKHNGGRANADLQGHVE